MMELKMKQCVLNSDSSALVSLLLDEGLTTVTLTKLDNMVTKDLSRSSLNKVSTAMKSLEKLSENKEHLQTLIHRGLTVKVLSWFEMVYNLLTSDLQRCSPRLYSLTEMFYDYILLLSQASLPVSQQSVVLLNLAQFALETKINFPLRLEAIRTFNSILESLSKDTRRLIQQNPDQNQIMHQMAAAILTVGDYELQVSLSEALCRLSSKKDRWQKANEWFSSGDLRNAFCEIRDGDFEVDCRRFLNFVNNDNRTERRIYTFPCLQAFLDATELFRPKDEKLDQFWIDFNLGSRCVSFFIDDPQGFLWGSIHLLREDVDHFKVWLKSDECTGGESILRVKLNRPIMHQNCRGQTVELTFNGEHYQHLEEAAYRVFAKESSPLVLQDSDSPVEVSSAVKISGGRKKSKKKSRLKVLPLSSPSSDDGSTKLKTPAKKEAERLFDLVKHSTPTYSSGAPVEVEPRTSEKESEKSGDHFPLLKEAVIVLDRKRVVFDSGYLSGQNEGASAHKKRVVHQEEEAESYSSPIELSPERVEPDAEDVSQLNDQTSPGEKEEEPKSDLTSGITAAFDAFKTNLEQHFTSSWQDVEAEAVLSLQECQQHITNLLSAVHKHRLLLLQRFEVSVKDQLKQLYENSESLNTINTEILSEMKRLGSFCDEHLHRLKTMEGGTSSSTQ